jgi:3-dehydroquinate synthase
MMQIQSHSHPYAVVECAGVQKALESLLEGDAASFFLVDEKVADLYRGPLAALPAERVYRIVATEEAKSYEQVNPVLCWLLGARCRRGSQLVVIGGGVLQDIGGFVASILLRGIRWTLLPTTLLAQCDSCVGSKSSLNIGRFKNQLGTFHPPHEVRLAFEFLNTLSSEEILGGLGEAIKLHLIDGPASVERLRGKLAVSRAAELPLRDIVWDSLRIKQRYVEQDEFDRGIRNLLNYGHTFAHAFESATQYAIPHGIAVSLGVACATFFSERLGMAPSGEFDRLRAWLQPYFGGYEQTLRRLDVAAAMAGMRSDKKNVGDGITFILTRGPGAMEKVGMDAHLVPALLQDCLKAL